MRYFTPELHLRSQPDQEWATVEAAMADSDRADDEYDAYLQQIGNQLPAGVRGFLDRIRLHDATVVGADGPADHGTFRLLLREEHPSPYHVELEYDAVDEPTWSASAFPPDHRGPSDAWLYDEFAAEPVLPSRPPVFVHSVLFADGRQLTVRFTDLRVHRFAPLPVAAHA